MSSSLLLSYPVNLVVEYLTDQLFAEVPALVCTFLIQGIRIDDFWITSQVAVIKIYLILFYVMLVSKTFSDMKNIILPGNDGSRAALSVVEQPCCIVFCTGLAVPVLSKISNSLFVTSGVRYCWRPLVMPRRMVTIKNEIQ